MAAKGALSPAMQQFFRAKDAHPDALVFFRMGDFYEMFYDDAVVGAQLLDLTLTSRSKTSDGDSIPMAGVPHHAAAGYIARLLEKGQKVAICEQMADPAQVKGLVPREVVRVVTPGLVLDETALDARASNHLVVAVAERGSFGIAALELSTSDLLASAPSDRTEWLTELVRLEPREVLVVSDDDADAAALRSLLPRASVSPHRPPSASALDDDARKVLGPGAFSDASHALPKPAFRAAKLALAYAVATQHSHAIGIRRIVAFDPGSHLRLDEAAIRNLELVRTLDGEKKGSLLHHLDCTRTAAGARLLRRRLLAPIQNLEELARRHDLVEAFVSASELRDDLRGALSSFADLERLATRALVGLATPRDLAAVRDALRVAAQLHDTLESNSRKRPALLSLVPHDNCADVLADLTSTLSESPPLHARDGNVIADGVDPRIDELRAAANSSQDLLLGLEERERSASGITTLRIGYTRVFGYYFEVTKKNLASVPTHFRRKQTVAGGERYTTDELDSLQGRLLNANERTLALEGEAFEALRRRVASHAHRLQALSHLVAELDVSTALADAAHRHSHVRPSLDDSTDLTLRQARHPVVEAALGDGRFVPNDLTLSRDGTRMMVITGPNMAGKSTFMRQTALAVILAQMGAFVPAKHATFGIVDRVFTRVGASDNLAKGESTFMLEMHETATILRDATRRSLVVLDEIGRGTSTYDGLAIAWAVAEHLHDHVGCRTLFATHYHELCALANDRRGIANFNVGAREEHGTVVFLHKLAQGGASRSYGIAVAKLAGVPADVVTRANTLAAEFERTTTRRSPEPDVTTTVHAAGPTDAAELTRRVLDVSLDDTTPREALTILADLQRIARAAT